MSIAPDQAADPRYLPGELRGFARTVAEIEWLLLVLVMLYRAAAAVDAESALALDMALFIYAAFVLGFHYFLFYRQNSHQHLALQTWVMTVFITWVMMYTGRLESPLTNLYILVVITSALTMGKTITLANMLIIAACYVYLGYPGGMRQIMTLSYASTLGAQMAPLLLVAYVTTLLAADTRMGISRVKRMADTDELTGVYNLRAFREILGRSLQLSLRYDRVFSILMVDSDNLKDVNDSKGHEAGNRLLTHIVKSIRDQLRATDVLARYGGDEFVVLLPETASASSVEVAERIRQAVEATPFLERDPKATATVSIGIACFPMHGRDDDAVMQKADQAMYVSKNSGRNRVTMYTSSAAANG